ncbi:hypothetical protein CH35J_006504 [Colletotrichum higginsianum]|uniref:Secreted protein n=1 Tax=Colletotrichum higginsianum TaxID=80884 RepID=A0A4T0W2K9_9PEZI|nr:hypothetical protein CH35J_006504 [Colletotrichum higginsianum]
MQGGASYPILRMLVLELLEALGVCRREVTSWHLARLTTLADALPSPSPSQSLDSCPRSRENGTPGRPSRPANITPGRDALGLSGSPILRASTLSGLLAVRSVGPSMRLNSLHVDSPHWSWIVDVTPAFTSAALLSVQPVGRDRATATPVAP